MPVSAIEIAGARTSPMRVGVALFLLSEAFFFGSLFWTYYYLRAYTPAWPTHHPSAALPIFNTAVLLVSSGTVWLGTRAVRRGSLRGLAVALTVTAILGAIFLGVTFLEWSREDFRPWTDAFGSIFFTLTGFHALHVLGGVVLMLTLLGRTVRGRFSADSFVAVEAGSLYWHFVDFIWILVFTTVFLIR